MGRRKHRIDVELQMQSSAALERELEAFANYCVTRIERELGTRERWAIELRDAVGGYHCRAGVHHRGDEVTVQGHGPDGALAIWDAMCRLEQQLRECGGSAHQPIAD